MNTKTLILILFALPVYMIFHPGDFQIKPFSSTHTLLKQRGPASDNSRVFKYRFRGDDLKLTIEGKSWEVGYKLASDKCMSYYKDKHPEIMEKAIKGNEDDYLSLIDVCANPREGNRAVSYDDWK